MDCGCLRVACGLFVGLLLVAPAGCDDAGGNTSARADVAEDIRVDAVAGTDVAEEVDVLVDPCHAHVFEDVQVPLRDGKWLAGYVRRPVDPTCQLPTILVQTPYDKELLRYAFEDGSAEPMGASRDYAAVVTDWRGMHGSAEAGDGPANPMDLPYGRDGYDTVEWIAEQSWSDGKVGLWGESALALVQYQTAVEQPPHLVAAIPICNPINAYYETYYPGGVLRKATYEWVLEEFGEGMAIVADHPTEDAVWGLVAGLLDPGAIQVPMLMMGGWYDLYNPVMWQTWEDVTAAASPELRDQHRLLIGDWHHFLTTSGIDGDGNPLTEQELRYSDPDRFAQWAGLAFFDLHLRGLETDAAAWAPIRFAISGSGVVESADAWPPAGSAEASWYLAGDGRLQDDAPDDEPVSFPYDPADPSPTVGGCTLEPSLLHGPHDQAEVIARNDAVVFVTEVLEAPLEIAGRPHVVLLAQTTGADTDFAVRLTDVDEQGAHLLVAEGIRRLKFREGFTTALPVEADTPYELTVEMGNLGYRFPAGHRVGLILTSSNYPLYDANPNTGDDFFASAEDSVGVSNTVHVDGSSRLVLPVYLP